MMILFLCTHETKYKEPFLLEPSLWPNAFNVTDDKLNEQTSNFAQINMRKKNLVPYPMYSPVKETRLESRSINTVPIEIKIIPKSQKSHSVAGTRLR